MRVSNIEHRTLKFFQSMSEFSNKNDDSQVDVTPEVKAKAQRAITILYMVMLVLIALPFVIMFFIKE